ncbi:MAG: enoyl-CoA hydratase/isomerase family protein, partial [Pseudomonadota bacterium]
MALADDIHIRVSGMAGRITLTRPQALNAMTYDMCMEIGEALSDWEANDAVKLVIIDAEGERSFCSGGDIADLYATGKAGDFAYGRKFWADEYRVNAQIRNYPKPFVAIMDGIVMGGGVGISAHGSHRIVTENTLFAMPECGIGLVPDVGGNWLLSRAPGHVGEYLATTGARLKAAD